MFSDGKLYLRETGEFNETNLLCSILRGQDFCCCYASFCYLVQARPEYTDLAL